MQHRTFLKDLDQLELINYNSKTLTLGSCFSIELSQKLDQLRFSVLSNPCGINFNPQSILNTVKRLIEPESLLLDSFQQHNEFWSHPDFHSQFSHPDQHKCYENALDSLQKAHDFAKNINTVILTIGTCFVYKVRQSGKIVNNCHKLPASNFEKSLLSLDEVTAILDQIISTLSNYSDQNINFILTLSPVRHIKNGLTADRKSKSIALLAIHEMTDRHDHCHYFPSYELLTDDLRDYRYYKADMIHPSKVAVDYIFEIFEENYLSTNEKVLRDRISNINSRLNHKPLFPETEAHQAFVKKLKADIIELEEAFPMLKRGCLNFG